MWDALRGFSVFPLDAGLFPRLEFPVTSAAYLRPISPLYSLVPAWRPSERPVLSGGRRVEWTVAGSVSVFQGFSCRYGIRLYQ